jgi:hypothetical protein
MLDGYVWSVELLSHVNISWVEELGESDIFLL